MALGSSSFKIIKAIDKLYLEIPEKIIKKFPNVSFAGNGAINTAFAGSIQATGIGDFQNNESLKSLKTAKSELINSMTCYFALTEFGASQWYFSISRQEHLDNVSLNFNSCPDQAKALAIEIVAFMRSTLVATDSVSYLDGISNDHLKSIYQRRETEINHLESISKSLIFDQEKYRQDLERSFDARRRQLDEDFEVKRQELADKETALKERMDAVDDRQAKHARRAVTLSMKDTLKGRSQEFKLSRGTVGLRSAIEYFSWFLIGFFALLFLITTLSSLKIIGDVSETDIIGLYIKQIALGVAFASTSVFYIRWRNLWFERHAQEEFLLKRQEIDLDRATWAIELASEWVDEKKRDIPEALISKLTNNLFEYQSHEAKNLHPAEDLASLILGSSAKVKLKVNDNEFELNHKGASELKRKLEEEH